MYWLLNLEVRLNLDVSDDCFPFLLDLMWIILCFYLTWCYRNQLCLPVKWASTLLFCVRSEDRLLLSGLSGRRGGKGRLWEEFLAFCSDWRTQPVRRSLFSLAAQRRGTDRLLGLRAVPAGWAACCSLQTEKLASAWPLRNLGSSTPPSETTSCLEKTTTPSSTRLWSRPARCKMTSVYEILDSLQNKKDLSN